MMPNVRLLALLVAAAACTDATGSGNGRVALRFGTVSPGSAANVADGAAASMQVADDVLSVGTNGTLRIDDIQLIVSEVELKRAENSICRHREKDDDDDDSDCRKFEGGPFLVNLPLGGGVVTLLEEDIPPGTFRAVEFEIDDFERGHDDDDGEHRRAADLLAGLRLLYPNVPPQANMVVHGVFTPTNGSPRPFTVYFNADVKIKQRFEEPLRVEEGGGITIRIDPTRWFTFGNQVRDLSALNGRLVDFDLDIRNGFVKVDCDD